MSDDSAEGARDARRAAENAARSSYGRLVSILAAANGDIALAEDALGEAFVSALSTWVQTGVPANPEGWLITVARNRQRDTWKSAAARTAAPLDEAMSRVAAVPAALTSIDEDTLGDRRLDLLFVCAHPAVDPSVRAPLMLQVVLGFEAAQIAPAFAMTTSTLAQRLVRAKRRIRDARIPFTVPSGTARAERLPAVLETIYGCFALSWNDADGGRHDLPESMAGEALHLAATLAQLLEDDAEAWSLAALIGFSLSRARGRGDEFIPLDEQDPARWDRALIAEAETCLRRAAAVTTTMPGRFQLEAAMQAVHAARAQTGETDWAALHVLCTALISVAPSLGALVAQAAIIGRLTGPRAGLEQLEGIDVPTQGFAPYLAARADLLARSGDANAADAFYEAASAADNPRDAAYLLRRAEAERSRHNTD